jgi:biotin operon repressor
MNPKIDNALHALVLIDKAAVSSVELAARIGCSRLTAVRLVESLRMTGCTIHAERDGHSYWYTLTDWGIFSPERVRLHVEQQKRVELK